MTNRHKQKKMRKFREKSQPNKKENLNIKKEIKKN